jgi:hypothetical protein
MKATAYNLAKAGWLVEVILPTMNNEPDSRFLAVGVESAVEAEEAVLLFPGLLRTDVRIARRQLSSAEIASLNLRPGAVRPYAIQSGQMGLGCVLASPSTA